MYTTRALANAALSKIDVEVLRTAERKNKKGNGRPPVERARVQAVGLCFARKIRFRSRAEVYAGCSVRVQTVTVRWFNGDTYARK